MTHPVPEPLPAAVEALLGDLKHRSQRDKDLLLTETDEAILCGLYHGWTLDAIGQVVGLKKQSVSRRRGVIRDVLQLFYLAAELDGPELQAYTDLYKRVRGQP